MLPTTAAAPVSDGPAPALRTAVAPAFAAPAPPAPAPAPPILRLVVDAPAPIVAPDDAVEVLRWPAQASRREELAADGRLRLLVLDDVAEPPLTWDDREEWVRSDADQIEVAHRIDQLRRRAAALDADAPVVPVIDVDGKVRRNGRTVRLRPAGVVLATLLLHRLERAVPVPVLAAHLAAAGIELDEGSLEDEVRRLRRSLQTLGLHLEGLGPDGLILLAD